MVMGCFNESGRFEGANKVEKDAVMDKLELILFNVGHGLSVALIEHPENYVTVVDLGSDDNLSPLTHLSQQKRLRADLLFITHPHADHLSDVETASYSTHRPDYIYCQDYNWDDVAKREKADLRDKITNYKSLIGSITRGDYRGNAKLSHWCWTPENAAQIFGDNSYVNNSSLFLIYTWNGFKISIAGDHETAAMERLCQHTDFVADAKGTDILITPHHGHSEGYTGMWPTTIGKPYITLTSVQSRDSNLATGYSKDSFAKGLTINGKTKYSLTTRDNGTITVTMWHENGEPKWYFQTEK